MKITIFLGALLTAVATDAQANVRVAVQFGSARRQAVVRCSAMPY